MLLKLVRAMIGPSTVISELLYVILAKEVSIRAYSSRFNLINIQKASAFKNYIKLSYVKTEG